MAILPSAGFFTPRRLAMAAALVLGARYLVWRATSTFNTHDAISTTISIVLYLAEVYGFGSMVFFYLQAAEPLPRTSPPIGGSSRLPSVDVFVTIYTEPTEILYRTLVGCLAMDYPEGKKVVYVLDDGRRPDVRDMAKKLGCRYLARSTREHAKAGNLNYGFSHSHGEIVMVMDCDHVPVKSFLTETIGFFHDPPVAVVQTPHHFYNPDPYQKNLKLEKEIVHEQDLFFHVIEPGKDRWNSAFFAGSCGLFRREALQQIGGFQTLTLTEDLHTSMLLHAKGYTSVYLNKDISAGLSPESYRGYIKQRQRWTRGGLQVFLLDNPLWKPGLTLMQRLNYFGAVYYFLHGFPRLLYLTAPLAFLFAGVSPLIATVPLLLWYFLPYYVSTMVFFHLISWGYRNPFWSDVYETVMCVPIIAAAGETVLHPRRTHFSVTPKGQMFEKARMDVLSVLPQAGLILLLIMGLLGGVWQLVRATADAHALFISLFWSVYNILLLLAAVVVARERPQKRGSPRLPRRIPCELIIPGGRVYGKTTDLSETGLSLHLETPFTLSPLVEVRLHSDFGEITTIKGKVIRNEPVQSSGEGVSVGIQFSPLTELQHQALIRQMYSSPLTWEGQHTHQTAPWASFLLLLMTGARAFIKEKILRRLSPRFDVKLPCRLILQDTIVSGTSLDISATGISILLPHPPEMFPSEFNVEISQWGQAVAVARGKVVWEKVSSEKGRVVGIRFLDESGQRLLTVLSRVLSNQSPSAEEQKGPP